jgi:hypothetical protein
MTKVNNKYREDIFFFGALRSRFRGNYNLMYNAERLGIPASLAIFMLTSQSASANNIGGFDCYGQTDCVN